MIKANVLIVDDEPADQMAYAAVLSGRGFSAVVRQPGDVSESDLRSADLIAIDYKLEWDIKTRTSSSLASWPYDGLALASVLSRHLVRLNLKAAIVLRSGQVANLGRRLPPGARVPLLAAQYGLDWILEKGSTDTPENIAAIATAFASLAPFLAVDAPEWNEGASWLGLSDTEWSEAALSEVQVCGPPEHAVAGYTGGAAWLQWFAHRALSFPSFIVSDLRAATVLRLPLSQFEALLSDSNSHLGQRIARTRYSGELADLAGRRWWRTGLDALIDELIYDATEDDTADALRRAYSSVHGSPVNILEIDQPVVTINADYEETGVAAFDDCVRLAPDFWPVFADQAYALIDDVEDDRDLAAMVTRGDRPRLQEIGLGR